MADQQWPTPDAGSAAVPDAVYAPESPQASGVPLTPIAPLTTTLSGYPRESSQEVEDSEHRMTRGAQGRVNE